ncbi:hypothetical protein QC761_0099420 [Podospora bellae-mahoneyi]|uniref:Uncharacterized protein n=1 Tax=Podospora bellae-mahoneyi TaxID=2093777 RepID=A0ABR0FEJ9_9PEZI|nr:hypothetical protein QC761_0099420 [Podospora bellae-mahoneyi]
MAPQNPDKSPQHIDTSFVPELCRSECYRAYEETQKYRKTPELCRTDSVFTKDFAACRTCILHQGKEGDDWTNANKFYLQPAFGEYVEYCDSIPVQSAPRTSSTSTRSIITTTTSIKSSTTTQVTTTVLVTEPPVATSSFTSTSTTEIAVTSKLAVETSTLVIRVSSVVRSPVSSPASAGPTTPPTPTPLPGPPSLSLTTVTIIVIPVFSAILLVAGLIYLYFHLRKRRKQKKATLSAFKEGNTLSKTSTWEKGEMSARISTLPRQEMEDWRGVKDLGPHELPVGASAQEIMDVKDGDGFDEGSSEEGKTVADSPTLSWSEMVGSETTADSPILESSEVAGTSSSPVSRGSIGSDR